MNEQVPGYHNTNIGISLQSARIKCATTLLLKLLATMKKKVKNCNKLGYIPSINVKQATAHQEEIASCISIISAETQRAEEMFNRFMCGPDNKQG